jgi:hypothetical protein
VASQQADWASQPQLASPAFEADNPVNSIQPNASRERKRLVMVKSSHPKKGLNGRVRLRQAIVAATMQLCVSGGNLE